MIPLRLSGAQRLLVLGAHCDDVEIGCGGTLLHLLDQHPDLEVRWVTFAGSPERRAETEKSAEALLQRAAKSDVEVHDFRESYFPWNGAEIKDSLQDLARGYQPDVVLTHHRNDRHQDHRLIAELTWNAFRNQVVLEYEVPKWEGDLGQPNFYVPLSKSDCDRKIGHLMKFYQSQRERDWFTEDLFRGLLRIRGSECRSPSGFAEAFHGAKLTFAGF